MCVMLFASPALYASDSSHDPHLTAASMDRRRDVTSLCVCVLHFPAQEQADHDHVLSCSSLANYPMMLFCIITVGGLDVVSNRVLTAGA